MDILEVPKISTDESAAAGIWRKLRAIHAEVGPTRKLVVLNPNASDKFPMRRLPLEKFTELARQLLEDPEVFVLITGVASEKPDAQHICARLGSPRALDLTGQTTITELLHLYDLAHVLVTNDSGPAHFAALTRIHEVVFFGPEIPERYRPLTSNSDAIHTGYSCSPCIGPHNQRRSPCNDNVCLKSINIEEIARWFARGSRRCGPQLLPLPALAIALEVAAYGNRAYSAGPCFRIGRSESASLPQCQEILVGRFGFGLVAQQRERSPQLQVRQCADRVRANETSMVEDLLKLGRRFRILAHGHESLAADIGRVQTAKIKASEVEAIHRPLVGKGDLQPLDAVCGPALSQGNQRAKHRYVGELDERVFREALFQIAGERL